MNTVTIAKNIQKCGFIIISLLTLFGLYLSSLYNYLLFHSLAELFSIVIACSIFVIAWNTRKYSQNYFFLFLGITALFVGIVDLIHTLAYVGMNIFKGFGSNLPTQLWIAARYLQGLSFLAAIFFLKRKFKPNIVLFIYTVILSLIFFSIFCCGVFPDCFIEGSGLTPFKKISEYIISFILLAFSALLYKNRTKFDKNILKWMWVAVAATIGSEIAFTFYVSVFGLSNLIGHIFKIIAFYFLYKAIVKTGLEHPYGLIFRDLKQRTKELDTRNQELGMTSTELLESKARVEAILQGIGDGVLVVDKDYKIIIFNKMSEQLSGYSAKEALGKRYDEVLRFVYEDSGRINDQFIKECMVEGKITEMSNHTSLIKKDGTKMPVADSAAPLKDKAGKVFGCVVVFRDITLAREVDIMKSEFVSIASHQLRTPLTAIKLFIEMLVHQDVGKLNQQQAEYIDNVKQSNERMIMLVNDLLNISRLESGRLRIEPEPIQMEDFIENIIEEAEHPDGKHKPQIKFKRQDAKLPKISVDPTLVRQVINNLLTNAIQYCRPHKCQVEVGLQLKGNYYLIYVKDNGIGIPKEAQPKIFERFFRAQNAVLLKVKGTGLGLYFAKMIIEAAGGKIWFESEEGKGTTFYITIPTKGMKRKGGEKGLTS